MLRASEVSFREWLPKEHGAWAFLLLPLLAGLLARTSWPGALIALGALAAFLARGPFQAGRRGRATWLPLGLLAAGCCALAVGQGGWVPFWALGAAAAMGLPLLGRSLREMRTLGSECLALMACGALLPAILGAGGAGPGEALKGWTLLMLLALPPLVHLRHRLRLTRQGTAPKASPTIWLIQCLATLIALGLWSRGLAPGLLPLWTLALLVRESHVRAVPPRRLGWAEAVVSLGHLGVLWVGLGSL